MGLETREWPFVMNSKNAAPKEHLIWCTAIVPGAASQADAVADEIVHLVQLHADLVRWKAARIPTFGKVLMSSRMVRTK